MSDVIGICFVIAIVIGAMIYGAQQSEECSQRRCPHSTVAPRLVRIGRHTRECLCVEVPE